MVNTALPRDPSHRLNRRKSNWYLPYLLVLPCCVIFAVFVFYPFLKNIYLSVMLTNAASHPVQYVGFSNYTRLFTSAAFLKTLRVSFVFALYVGSGSFFIGFILALAANERLRGSRVYETMYSLPLAIASVPTSMIFFVTMTPSGALNWLFQSNIGWLTDARYALYSVGAVTIWSNMGINVVFLLTGFRNIPADLIESSRIDGAGYFTRLFKIIIPMASPQIFFVVFYNIIASFQSFAQIRLLTKGEPYGTTEILIYSIYKSAFLKSRFETACAQSVILFLIIFIITRIQFLFERKDY